jgi:quinol monooxygenase YgiN
MENTNKLEISAIMKIPKGKLEEFKELVTESIRLTNEKDTETIKYDFFISSDETECEIREEYKNSEAVLEHMVNLREVLDKFSIEFPIDHVNVYGNPSPELLEAAKGFDIRVYSFSQGLEEMIESY